jgi:hypothetical protein
MTRVAALVLALAACDRAPECPACVCECPGAATAAATPAPAVAANPAAVVPVAAPAVPGVPPGAVVQPVAPLDVGEAIAGASRKMMHGDGAGCLADLDRVAAVDPKLEARLATTRGQCEMLVGQCQAGKARVAAWYRDETAMHEERAALTAESIAAMRCRDGDSTDRDRLLRAYWELSDGAYVNKPTAARCQQQLAVAVALRPQVKPRGPDDGPLSGGGQALFHTAAACFAHAGDCQAAWQTYRELFPAEGLAALPGDERERAVRQSFDAGVPRCAR